jgi:PiT family inorganic phosphate transporter
VTTPIAAGAISFVLLFFVQNVFSQRVYEPVSCEISYEVATKLQAKGLYDDELTAFIDKRFASARLLRQTITPILHEDAAIDDIVALAALQPLTVDIEKLNDYLDYRWYSKEQVRAVFRLHGRRYRHIWQFEDALTSLSEQWRLRPRSTKNKIYNKELRVKIARLVELFEDKSTVKTETAPSNAR